MSTRQRSAVEITDAYLAAVSAAQPSLRAFLATTPDAARAAAAAVDARRAAGEVLGPLAGIPLAIKARASHLALTHTHAALHPNPRRAVWCRVR
jgi:aspartyl-tRNA(Asn)/glutamyl-tRNA(Gln) amidotransferase subunit A